jgi:hypothetical protein
MITGGRRQPAPSQLSNPSVSIRVQSVSIRGKSRSPSSSARFASLHIARQIVNAVPR